MKTAQKPAHIKSSWEVFDSDDIDSMLETSKNFRMMSLPQRDNWLALMRAGKWNWETGESVKLDEDGNVVDGQHRLSALAIYQRETGIRQWVMVVRGVSPKSAPDLDGCKKRTFADYAKSEGVKRHDKVSAIIIGQLKMSSKKREDVTMASLVMGMSSRHKTIDGKEKVYTSYVAPNASAMIDVWKRHRGEIEYWAKVAEDLGEAKLARPSLLGAIGFQLAKIDDTNAKLFFSYLIEGSRMKDGDPALVLRELLRKAVGDESMTRAVVGACLIKAWRFWNDGRTVKMLRWLPAGPKAESFPDHRLNGHEVATET